MRRTLLVTLLLVPALAFAQTNTTGTIAPNTTVSQAQVPPPTDGTTTPTTPTPAVAAPPTTATPAPAPRDVAIVLCAQDFSTGTGRLLVFTASTSTGAPTIAAGAPCAQALSDLFLAGFGVIDVLPFDQQLQYTLVR